MDDTRIASMLHEAFAAARKATDAYLAQHPDDWYPCGFAWVRFPGRSPAARVLKEHFSEQERGHRGYPRGWDVWNPSGHGTQCMDAKFAGARAFADVMGAYGFECYADWRMD